MIEHHIQNDFDSRPVQGLDHIAEFFDRARADPGRELYAWCGEKNETG